MEFIGRAAALVKVVCLFWSVAAGIRVILALFGGSTSSLKVHFGLFAMGIIFYWGASVVHKSVNSKLKSAAVATLRSRWWGATFGFRLTTAMAVGWIVASWTFQESYDRNWNWIAGPAIGLLVAYWTLTSLVISKDSSLNAPALAEDIKDETIPATAQAKPIDRSEETPAGRARALDELIKRMKT
jgi:hypothetical protein